MPKRGSGVAKCRVSWWDLQGVLATRKTSSLVWGSRRWRGAGHGREGGGVLAVSARRRASTDKVGAWGRHQGGNAEAQSRVSGGRLWRRSEARAAGQFLACMLDFRLCRYGTYAVCPGGAWVRRIQGVISANR